MNLQRYLAGCEGSEGLRLGDKHNSKYGAFRGLSIHRDGTSLKKRGQKGFARALHLSEVLCT